MLQPTQLKDVSWTAVRRSAAPITTPLKEGILALEHGIRDLPDAAKSTARLLISAEERLRQRIRSVLRVALATLFLGLSGLISLGANVTMAFARKVSPEASSSKEVSERAKRARHTKTPFHLRHPVHATALRTAMDATASHQANRSSGHGAISRGKASWYGGEFNQRKTASGLPFDTHAMMAAHRTLPFGTRVRVTNTANHTSCIVTITDRGPFSHHRIIDLSYAAASKLGMTRSGTATVDIQVLGAESIFDDIATVTNPSDEKPGPVFDRIPAPETVHANDKILAEAMHTP